MSTPSSSASPPPAPEAVPAAAAQSGAAAEAAPTTSGSTATIASNTKQQHPHQPSALDFEPPLACVRRILKHTLPSSTNVGKDASAAFARASGIFIIYLTACANDFAREHKRQTVTANDVLAAIKELDFDEFTPEMLKFLESYRRVEKNKKDAKAAAVEAAKKEEEEEEEEDEAAGRLAASSPSNSIHHDDDEEEEDDEQPSPPAANAKKHPRQEPEDADDDDDDDESKGSDRGVESEEPEPKRAKTAAGDGGDQQV